MGTSWRISVIRPGEADPPNIDMDDAVAGLESFSIDSAGSCLEASFTALPNAVDLRPRDQIRLFHSVDNFASDVTFVYAGVIVSAGNAHASRLQRFRAVGLKQRFYEATLFAERIPGGDVAAMGLAVAAAVGERLGVIWPASFVDFGFELGDRYPGLESAGEAMDALAETVGSFVQPAGDPYVYDGVTYTEGMVVPAARWGVSASGVVFFRRPQNPMLTFDEVSPDVHVRWQPSSAEQVADRVTFVYASEYNGSPSVTDLNTNTPISEPSPLPLSTTHEKPDSPYAADRVVALDAPLDFMKDLPYTADSNAVTDPGNASDGVASTYAAFGPPDLDGDAYLSADAEVENGAILVLDFQTSENALPGGRNIRVYATLGEGLAQVASLSYDFEPEAATRRAIFLPLMKPAQVPGAVTDIVVTVMGAESVRVHEMSLYAIDDEVAERLASAFYRDVLKEVSAIEYHGLLDRTGGYAEWVEVTAKDDTTALARVERVEVSITTDGGLRTIIHSGQGYEADLEAQRVMLERLARRAVDEGGGTVGPR